MLASIKYFLANLELLYSLAPLVKKVNEPRVLEMTNKLCDKLLNVKEQHRDVASIALKTIVSEVSSSSAAQIVLDSLTPQLTKGITGTVSTNFNLLENEHHVSILLGVAVDI